MHLHNHADTSCPVSGRGKFTVWDIFSSDYISATMKWWRDIVTQPHVSMDCFPLWHSLLVFDIIFYMVLYLTY